MLTQRTTRQVEKRTFTVLLNLRSSPLAREGGWRRRVAGTSELLRSHIRSDFRSDVDREIGLERHAVGVG